MSTEPGADLSDTTGFALTALSERTMPINETSQAWQTVKDNIMGLSITKSYQDRKFYMFSGQ